MGPFLFLLSSYVLTLLGFLLGKSTFEEHKEVKEFARWTAFVFIVLFYAFLLYISYGVWQLYVFVALAFVFLFGWFEFNLIEHLHNVVLLVLGLVFLRGSEFGVYPVLALVFAMILINSFKEFDVREEVYSFVLMCIVYVGAGLF